MSEEKKTVELKEEELEKVSGGERTPRLNMYCPDCDYCFGTPRYIQEAGILCPTCNIYVTPVLK